MMSVSNQTFFLLLGITLLAIGVYRWGYRRNLRLCQCWAQSLEKLFQPVEKQYTWLGGVVGFTADYYVPPFKLIKVVLCLKPRQSLLYLPFGLITGSKDKIQVLFYLPWQVTEERHLVKKGLRMPKIYNQAHLKSKDIMFRNQNFRLLFETTPFRDQILKRLTPAQLSALKHLALTKENHLLYLEFQFRPHMIEEITQAIGFFVSAYKKPPLSATRGPFYSI